MSASQHFQLVVDASVLINLASTEHSRDIIGCLAERVLVVEAAYAEVRRDPRTGKPTPDLLTPLLHAGVLSCITLTPTHLTLAVELAGAPEPDDLDDGEAATIAFAAIEGAAIGLDDTKAIRISAQRYPTCRVATTIDLLRRQEVCATLGTSRLADAVYDALRFGRMRVPQSQVGWVVELIGRDRAAECPSLRRALHNRELPAQKRA